MTPTLSVEAVHERVAEVAATALVARPVGVEGGVVSAQAVVVTLFVAVPETLPAASKATTPSVYVVPQVSPV